LYHHPPHIFYVQTRLHFREKWIEYRHQKSINQWLSWFRHNMLVDADTRPSTEQQWQSFAIETALYSFVKSILTHYCEKWWCYLEISPSPIRLYCQIVYTANIDSVRIWGVLLYSDWKNLNFINTFNFVLTHWSFSVIAVIAHIDCLILVL